MLEKSVEIIKFGKNYGKLGKEIEIIKHSRRF